MQETLATGEGALVVFYAPWCGHCHTAVPSVKEAATELKSSGVRVVAIDGQQSPRTAAHLGVRGYPTILWLQMTKQPDGEEAIAMAQYNGARDAASLIKFAKAADTASKLKSKLPKGEAVAEAATGKEGTEAKTADTATPEAAEEKKGSKLGASKLGASKMAAGGSAPQGVQKAKMPAEAASEAAEPAEKTAAAAA